MFLEPSLHNDYPRPKTGWIEVICGSMFSGKTEELIRRVNRAILAKQDVRIFKPSVDTRYHEMHVVSHDKNKVVSTPVPSAVALLSLAQGADVVAIDEAQFFDGGLVDVCVSMANQGQRVIVCGLDMDFLGQPFGVLPQLMSVAEFVTKLHAICMTCGGVASYSFRLVESDEQVLLGEKNEYEARCRKCFNEGMAVHQDQTRSQHNHFE